MREYGHSARTVPCMTNGAHPTIEALRNAPDDSCATFATVFDALVRDRGLSNPNLADLTGYEQSYFSRLRTGDRLPSRDAVLAIAEAMGLLGCDRDRLLISAGYFPWQMPDDATLQVLRRLMEANDD